MNSTRHMHLHNGIVIMQMGGLGFLHYNMTVEEQAEAVRSVKRIQRDTAAEKHPTVDENGRSACTMNID